MESIFFYGKVGGTFTKREMTSPSFTTSAESSGFHPVYGQTEGLSSRQIEAAVRQALSLLPERVNDPLPEELRASYQLEELGQAIRGYPSASVGAGFERRPPQADF